jgi:hypothetical protein
MADEHVDPSGNTDQFRAFVESKPAESAPSKLPLLIGVAVAVVVVAVIAALLLMK